MINLPKVALTIPKGIKIGAPTEEIGMVWKVTLGMKHPVDAHGSNRRSLKST